MKSIRTSNPAPTRSRVGDTEPWEFVVLAAGSTVSGLACPIPAAIVRWEISREALTTLSKLAPNRSVIPCCKSAARASASPPKAYPPWIVEAPTARISARAREPASPVKPISRTVVVLVVVFVVALLVLASGFD